MITLQATDDEGSSQNRSYFDLLQLVGKRASWGVLDLSKYSPLGAETANAFVIYPNRRIGENLLINGFMKACDGRLAPFQPLADGRRWCV